MNDTRRGANKCDECGRFRSWDDLCEDEFKSLDEYGHLTERWFYLCRICETGLFPTVTVEALV